MPDISSLWIETLPSDGSAVGISPPEMRNIWNAIDQALPTSIQSFPEDPRLVPGAAKMWIAAESASSNPADWSAAGKVFIASDTSRAFVYRTTADGTASDGTFLFGSYNMLEHYTPPASGAWQTISGATAVSGAQAALTMYYQKDSEDIAGKVTFAAAPQVIVSSSNTSFFVTPASVAAGSFVVEVAAFPTPYSAGGGGSTVTVRFTATGRVVPML